MTNLLNLGMKQCTQGGFLSTVTDKQLPPSSWVKKSQKKQKTHSKEREEELQTGAKAGAGHLECREKQVRQEKKPNWTELQPRGAEDASKE